MKWTAFLAMLFLFLCRSGAYGWGAGHEDQVKLLLRVLPEQVQGFFPPAVQSKMIRSYSHFPDSFAKFDEAFIGPDAVAVLGKYDIKKRFGLHYHKGAAVCFILLTKAFREKNAERASLWAAALCHSLGDESACNHDPLIHYITYALVPYGVKMGKGVGVDFSQAARSKEGPALLESLVKDFAAKPISPKPAETLMKLMMYTIDGCTFMTRRTSRIAATFAQGASPEVMADGRKALAELGVDGARIAADAVVTAWQYAAEGKEAEITAEVMKTFNAKRVNALENRPISADTIYKGLLDEDPQGRFIGMIIEPSQTMNQVYLGFSSKFIMTSAMWVVKDAGIPFRALDLRDVAKNGMPAPAQMPVAVICSGRFHPPAEFRKSLSAYIEAGGKFLWIGGRESKLLAPFSESFKPVDDKLLPVSKKYGEQNAEIIKKSAVTFRGGLARVLGTKPYPFKRNPNTRAGWQKPYCPYEIESGDPNITVLAVLNAGDATMNIAAAYRDASGKAKFIFVPEYIIAPFLLSEDTEMRDPSRPRLDSVGRKVLTEGLRMLAPELVSK